MEELKLFGKRLKELRKKKGFTQEQLAEKINLFPKQIGNIETGNCFTTIVNLKKIADVLDVEISDLFDFDYLEDREFLEEKIINLVKSSSNDELRSIYRMMKFICK